MGYGYKNYWFTVHDTNGDAIGSGLKVTILEAGVAIATVYSDDLASSLTNPITSTVFEANDGLVKWYSPSTSFDIEIVDEAGGHMKVLAYTGAYHTIVFDPSRRDCQLVSANILAGAELVDSAGVDVDYPHSATISGEELKAGDVVHIRGTVLAADFHAEEELEIIVLFGTEAILNTGDVVIVGDEDTIKFDLYCTVTVAGASGFIKTEGVWWTDLGGTTVAHLIDLPAATAVTAAGVTEDMSGDVIIKVTGDYKDAHPDQESYLSDLKVFIYHNGGI